MSNNTNVCVNERCPLDFPKTYGISVVKPNPINGVNILTQGMLNKKNTKYVITLDFTLAEDIVVPQGCIIEFDGGSITNINDNGYSLTGQNTILSYIQRLYAVIKGVELKGTFVYKDGGLAADEEDITGEKGALQFANKEFNPDVFSGYGRVYLRKNIIVAEITDGWFYMPADDGNVYLLYRKNGLLYSIYDGTTGLVLVDNVVVEITDYDADKLPETAKDNKLSYVKCNTKIVVTLPNRCTITDHVINNSVIKKYDKNIASDGKNVLTQDMLTSDNTIYILQYDYDLNGQEVTVPENCVVIFQGGSVRNGRFIGQDTLYYNICNDKGIFGDNEECKVGTWRLASGSGGGGGIPDKEYDPEHFSGLGRKTLRLKDGSNILTQDDFDKDNTIYVITYDFDLGGDTITIPENSVLEFDGGSISNGTLTGNNTIIDADAIQIFGSNTTLSGTWSISEVYVEWFGAKGDGITDDTISFTKCLQYFKNVKGVLEHTYKATITFTNSYSRISNLNLIGFITFNEGLRFINIDNCKIDASDCEHGIDVPHNVIKLTINDVYVHDAIRNGINLIDCWDSTLTKISTSSNGEIGFYAEQFNNGYFQGTAYGNGIGVKIWGTTACTVKATAQENLKTGVDLRSVHASLMNLYLEQNGYQGSDLCEKSQIAIGYNESPCIGDNITVYGMGGSGSSMESPYGCTLFYAENCNVNGYFIRHTESGFRVTSNTVRCKANVLDLNHEDYGYDRNLERQITAITVDSNTPFDIPVNSYCIPVVLGETPYAASLVINTSTSALIRVKDSEGNNVSVQCLVYIASDGIRRSR